MLLQLDFESEEPIYLQIRNQIVQGIAAGALRDGERLPTIRAFADESGVNMMTVSKAYQQLRREGYLTADRRGGTVVSAQPRGAGVPDKTLRALRLCLSELRVRGWTRRPPWHCAARRTGRRQIRGPCAARRPARGGRTR